MLDAALLFVQPGKFLLSAGSGNRAPRAWLVPHRPLTASATHERCRLSPGIVKLLQKTIRMCSNKKTIRHFLPSRPPVFSPPVACQVCSRGRGRSAIFINLTMPTAALRIRPVVLPRHSVGRHAHRPAATDCRSPGSAWPTVPRSGHRPASAVRSRVGTRGTLG